MLGIPIGFLTAILYGIPYLMYIHDLSKCKTMKHFALASFLYFILVISTIILIVYPLI